MKKKIFIVLIIIWVIISLSAHILFHMAFQRFKRNIWEYGRDCCISIANHLKMTTKNMKGF